MFEVQAELLFNTVTNVVTRDMICFKELRCKEGKTYCPVWPSTSSTTATASPSTLKPTTSTSEVPPSTTSTAQPTKTTTNCGNIARNITCDDIVIVFDKSSSMNYNGRIDKAKQAITKWFEKSVPDGTNIGLVTFNNYAKIEQSLIELNENSLEVLTKAVSNIWVSGGTCIGAGIRKAIENRALFAKKTGGTIILVGDGQDGCGNKPDLNLNTIKDLCIKTNKTVYGVNVGSNLDVRVQDLANATGGKVFDVPDSLNVDEFNDILKKICNDECPGRV